MTRDKVYYNHGGPGKKPVKSKPLPGRCGRLPGMSTLLFCSSAFELFKAMVAGPMSFSFGKGYPGPPTTSYSGVVHLLWEQNAAGSNLFTRTYFCHRRSKIDLYAGQKLTHA